MLARLAADENFDARIVGALVARLPALSIVTVAQAGLRGANDPAVLDWAAREERVLLSHDERTMPYFVFSRMDQGLPTPGVILVPDRLPIGTAVEELLLVVQALRRDEVAARGVVRLPL